MGESWGTPVGPMAWSTEEARRRLTRNRRQASLDPDDFRDVFGGPPRSVLLSRFSGDPPTFDRAQPSPLYSDMFRPPSPATWRGWVRTEAGFYYDIFGSDGGGGDRRRSTRSRSSASTSILSSEYVSPPIRGAAMATDAMLSSYSSFAYKQRPITIPPRCHTSSSSLSTNSREEHSSRRSPITMQHPSHSYFVGSKHTKHHNYSSSDLFGQRSHIGFSCCFSSPKTFSLEASFRGSHEKSLQWDNSESPSSAMTSVFVDPVSAEAEREAENVMMDVEGEEEGVAGSSFTIEFDGHGMQGSVDEAISWTKAKLWN